MSPARPSFMPTPCPVTCQTPKNQRRKAYQKHPEVYYFFCMPAGNGESMVLKLVVARRLVVLATGTASLAVKLAGDGVGDVGQLLLLLLKVLGVGGGR